jgi:hypothetical protein
MNSCFESCKELPDCFAFFFKPENGQAGRIKLVLVDNLFKYRPSLYILSQRYVQNKGHHFIRQFALPICSGRFA